ncbi:type I polyketide synthase [Nocardia coubleae]|uniref:Type I polyketide synthase n=1 Tax=Nocardia coubleae TaxID=356147 RepID=A0A846W6J3_9NOCA|nr:type I polyketide synthase [Nocardia coubleae]NKX88821.1 type I polyketide synthase [Nocardia coubleae]
MTDIAIVGIGCRYAGGIDSPESFWDFVIHKRDGVREIPEERWDWRRYYDEDRRAPGRMYTKRGAFMTGDPWAFDPEFFGISPREATSMDPQQRLILEVAWEALDDAGVAGRAAGSSLGVYVGAFTLDQMVVSAGAALPHVDLHTAVGVSYTMLSNRLAYALDLRGPAVTVDTACSSSLVALHLACRAIADGDCEVAIAGGVNVMVQPETFVTMCKGGFLAADGRSKPFDAAADGYGRGEGAGVVVLKKLADAERDGDRVYALVKATGANQDGRTTAITVPNAESQESLAREVIRRSGIDVRDVTYVEAHGTGTPVGDPIELRAIGRAYGAPAGRPGQLGVGSLKATLGHTEAASGVASIIKSALAIRHRTIPPQGWLDTPNPDIPFDEWGIRVLTEAEPVGPDVERMAVAVNGFGYGGTNAHAILQEHRPSAETVRPPVHFGVLPLSGRSEGAVRELARGFAERIADGADPQRLAEAAWRRRQHHPVRTGVAFGDDTELVQGLIDLATGSGRVAKTVAKRAGEPVFVCTGMGPQWWGMARELLTAEGTFAVEAKRVDAEFQAVAGWSIIEELLRPEEESRVPSTAVAQPANFLVQVALFATLRERGIEPAAVVGHSVGEVAAAYLTGMLSLGDAVLVSYHRSRLQATTAGTGGMLAVGLGPDEAGALVAGEDAVDIAAINSPSAVTLAGAVDRLGAIAETLTERGVFARRLQVEVPYHSALMDPILDELRAALADITVAEPRLPLYSTVTGELVTGADWDADYWCANVRQPVRFAAAATALVKAGHRVFLEVGPHPVLGANIREILIGAGETGTTIATLHRKQDDAHSMRQVLADLYAAGALDIDALFTETVRPTPHIDLPSYPWQRTVLRSELPELRTQRHGTPDAHPLLGDRRPDDASTWRLNLSTAALPWLTDHVVGGTAIMPGSGYLDAALSAAAVRAESEQVGLEDVRFVAPLVVDGGDAPIVELHLEVSTRRFTIRSRGAAGSVWTVHATGRLVEGSYAPVGADVPDLSAMTPVEPADFYTGLVAAGLEYGPAFQRVTAIRLDTDTVVARVNGEIDRDARYLAHPAVVDAALQTVAALLAGRAAEGAMVPVGVRSVRRLAALPAEITVVTRMSGDAADIDLLGADNAVCLQLRGVRFASLTPGAGPLQRMSDFFYEERWELREPVDTTALPGNDGLFTLVLGYGEGVEDRVERVHQAVRTGAAGSAAVLLDDAELEANLTARLRDLFALEAVERVHVCVVPGASADGDIPTLWTLRRVAATLESFLDDRANELAVDLPMTGDGSLHATVVTANAYAHPADPTPPSLTQAAIAGARRVLLNEQSRLRWRLVDIDARVTEAELAAELAVPGAFTYDRSDEVILRDGLRWVTVVDRTMPQRLETLDTAEPLTDPEANFELELPRSRTFARLGWRRCERRAPGPGEVELRMRAVGLNYKDALKVIGVLGERELAPTYFGTVPGMEGAATVVRVGAGVTDVAVGDEVTVTSKGMIARFHTTDAALLARVRPGTDPGRCTSGTAFATAEHSLLELARIQPGETVLIHGAAGGVGTAAVQIAKQHGAVVIGTASTEQRRALVSAEGADHVLGSRSLTLVDQVLALTDGRGVDVILSTAPGELQRQNFTMVAEFGRIVEIGKADIYAGGVLELAAFDKNIAYYSFDLDRMARVRRDRVLDLVRGINARLDDGTYRALPFTSYGTAEVGEAFEAVARSTGTGRVALDLTEAEPLVRPALPQVRIEADANYLITGGFGAFGLATGRWLVGNGARHLTLLGRSGPTTGAAVAQLAAWAQQGITVVSELVDITDAEAVAAVIDRAHTAEHPLRGVFHTAGVIDDKRATVMDIDSLSAVYRPKVDGVRALAAGLEAAGVRLDHFVLYSSGSTMFGAVGQFAYTAANSALQAMAESVVRAGGTALAVGWGHMSGGGMAAADEHITRYLRTTGFDPLDMDEGAQYLEQALRLGITQAAIIPIDWAKVDATAPFFAKTGRLETMIAAAAQDDSAASQLRIQLAELDEDKRGEVVAYMLAEQLAQVMGVAADSIDLSVPVPELGLDSLMAVEFGALVSKSLGVELLTLQMGRSFSLEQAGVRVAEAIVGVRA